MSAFFLPTRRQQPRLLQHRVELDADTCIDYRIRWSKRRTLALQIDRRGVHVFAPHSVSLAQIEHFVETRRDWLRRQHARWQQRAANCQTLPCPLSQPPACECGERFAWLGGSGTIRRDTAFSRPQWRNAVEGVQAHLPADLGRSEAVKAFQRLFEQQALAHFQARVADCCQRLGLPTPAVRLSRARTRWGSCSQRSGIRLNLRLIALDEMLIDYVVAHEVTHLLEMNHSARFWQLLAALFPRCEEARARLRQFSCSP